MPLKTWGWKLRFLYRMVEMLVTWKTQGNDFCFWIWSSVESKVILHMSFPDQWCVPIQNKLMTTNVFRCFLAFTRILSWVNIAVLASSLFFPNLSFQDSHCRGSDAHYSLSIDHQKYHGCIRVSYIPVNPASTTWVVFCLPSSFDHPTKILVSVIDGNDS